MFNVEYEMLSYNCVSIVVVFLLNVLSRWLVRFLQVLSVPLESIMLIHVAYFCI